MGKPYTYTRVFKPIQTYDYRFWVKLEKNLIHFEELLETNPIEETPYMDMVWHFPLQSKPRKDLYNIIILIAKITGTKMMYKYGLDNSEPYQYFLIIGENTRVKVCNHILNYTFEGIFKFEDYLRKNERERSKDLGYRTISSYINLKVSQRLYKIMDQYSDNVETGYETQQRNRLENFIMGQYKLDYKMYGQFTNLYSNAISKVFHPKRMML